MTGKSDVFAQWLGLLRSWRGAVARDDDAHETGGRRSLCMVVGFLEPNPPPFAPLEFCYAPTGVEAVRKLYEKGVRERLEVVVVEEGLLDIPGLNLLRRIGAEAPSASRILLLDPGYLTSPPDELAELGLDDTWVMPKDGRTLAKRVLGQRQNLAKTRAVYQRLEALTLNLEDLEKRYFHVRSARDRIARNVHVALAGDDARREGMLRWWQGYRTIVHLRAGFCSLRPKPLPIVELLGQVLAEEAFARWPFPVRMPAGVEVWLDSVLAGPMTRSLFRGLLEAAEPFSRVRWGRMRRDQDCVIIELKVEPILECIEDIDELIEDPFARLPDGPLRELSIDLPLAHEMLQAMGGGLKGRIAYRELIVEWRLPHRRLHMAHPLAHPPGPLGQP